MRKDINARPEPQQQIYAAVERLTETSGKALIPLTDVAAELRLTKETLLAQLYGALLDIYLNYREDQPDSPGWLAVDPGAH